MCKNDVFVAKICNCKIRCFLSRKFANARSALALRDIWRLPLARQLIAACKTNIQAQWQSEAAQNSPFLLLLTQFCNSLAALYDFKDFNPGMLIEGACCILQGQCQSKSTQSSLSSLLLTHFCSRLAAIYNYMILQFSDKIRQILILEC